MSYCSYCNTLPTDHIDRIYHDTVYGRQCKNDSELFGRLVLEINQAGLSWHTILNKSQSIRKAYANYNIEFVAGFNENTIEKLLANKGVIRHKGKIQAIVFNAQQILSLDRKSVV